MPLYDYRCTECGNEIEVMHSIDGSGPTECDVCGGTMRKALSPPAIHFKGSGWAKKDARTAASKKTSSSSSSGSSASDKSDGTAETKKPAGDGKAADGSTSTTSTTGSKTESTKSTPAPSSSGD